ncbi:hypothetical protein, partial [Escherichia coli]|uniref:hypothetical protein n=1 Tax=Escherichia coli TaxID=562 RepID=UPI001BCE6E56
GKRYCCISSGTAAGTGTAENLTAWPVYRNHLRYPDVNPPLVAVSMLMLMYAYISINDGALKYHWYNLVKSILRTYHVVTQHCT